MLCRDEAYDGWWQARDDSFCYATQATEQWQRKHQKEKDWQPEPGQILYAELPADTVAAGAGGHRPAHQRQDHAQHEQERRER